MSASELASRLAPYVRELVEDDDVQAQVRRTADAVRRGRGGRAARRSPLRRAGVVLREGGQALVTLGRGAEKRQRPSWRRPLAALALGGAAAATAIVVRTRRAGAGEMPETHDQEQRPDG